MTGKIVSLLFLALAVANADVRLDVIMSARNLPNMDIFEGSPDAYVRVFYAESDTSVYDEIGETANISDNNNPDWSEIFNFYVTGAGGTSSPQRVKLEIYDADSPDADDYIGYVELHLSDIVNAFGHHVELQINPADSGTLILQGKVDGSFPAGQKIDDRFLHPSKIISVPSHLPQTAFAKLFPSFKKLL